MVEDYTIKARNQMDKGKITCPYVCSARGMLQECYENRFFNCEEYKTRHQRDISDFLEDKKKEDK